MPIRLHDNWFLMRIHKIIGEPNVKISAKKNNETEIGTILC